MKAAERSHTSARRSNTTRFSREETPHPCSNCLVVNQRSHAAAGSVGLPNRVRGILQPPEPRLLISGAQEQRRQRLDAAAPTYRHAVFCNPPPQVIYSNTDSADSGARVPPHYAVTQTGLFALPLQIRHACMTSAGERRRRRALL